MVISMPGGTDSDRKRPSGAESSEAAVGHKKAKSETQQAPPFEGNKAVPLSLLTAAAATGNDESNPVRWVVVHDVVVDGTEQETHGRVVDGIGISTGATVVFSPSADHGESATIEICVNATGDNHLEGTLKPAETVHLPSGDKVLSFEWSPPPEKKSSDVNQVGYSDVWDQVQTDDMGPVFGTVEHCDDWKSTFPLISDLFDRNSDNEDEEVEDSGGDDDGASHVTPAEKARQKLPSTGIIMLVH